MGRHRSDAPPAVPGSPIGVPRPISPATGFPAAPASRDVGLPAARPAGTRPPRAGRHSWAHDPADPAADAPITRGPDLPFPRSGRRGPEDPDTTPLDLAAIALASRGNTGSHRLLGGGSGTGGFPTATGRSGDFPRTAYSAPSGIPAAPATGGHRAAVGVGDRVGRILTPSRTVGALALLGAVAGAGVAAAGSGTMLTRAEQPAAAEFGVPGPPSGPVTASGGEHAGHGGAPDQTGG